jgi:dienelactone hydrolase
LVVALLLFTWPVAANDFAAAQPLFGAWRRSDGTLLVVGRSDDALFVFDDATGLRRRASLSAQELRVSDGRLALAGNRLAGRLGGNTVAATRVPIVTEEVHWSNGDVALSGTLWRPAGAARTPAVVLVHGSGPETRWGMRQLPAWLAAHGVTAIAYDKREHSDPWDAGIDVLAGDALGAVALLRARTDVDVARVGLLGISNGAFVIVRAAARSRDVGFVVPVVGGGGALYLHELHRMHRAGLEAKLGAFDQAALDAFMRDLYRPQTFAADGKPRAAQLLANARGQRWFALTSLERIADMPVDTAFTIGQRSWANELAYDPAGDLEKLGARPALFLLAGADDNVDSARAAQEIAQHAPRARVVTISGASHYLTLPTTHGDAVALAPLVFSTLREFFR